MEARVKPTGRGVVLSGDEVGAAACGIAALLTTRLRRREGVAGGAVVNGLHVMKVIHEATAVDVTAESCIWHESIATLTSPHVADAAGKEVGEQPAHLSRSLDPRTLSVGEHDVSDSIVMASPIVTGGGDHGEREAPSIQSHRAPPSPAHVTNDTPDAEPARKGTGCTKVCADHLLELRGRRLVSGGRVARQKGAAEWTLLSPRCEARVLHLFTADEDGRELSEVSIKQVCLMSLDLIGEGSLEATRSAVTTGIRCCEREWSIRRAARGEHHSRPR